MSADIINAPVDNANAPADAPANAPVNVAVPPVDIVNALADNANTPAHLAYPLTQPAHTIPDPTAIHLYLNELVDLAIVPGITTTQGASSKKPTLPPIISGFKIDSLPVGEPSPFSLSHGHGPCHHLVAAGRNTFFKGGSLSPSELWA
jgi:hypothetical protein